MASLRASAAPPWRLRRLSPPVISWSGALHRLPAIELETPAQFRRSKQRALGSPRLDPPWLRAGRHRARAGGQSATLTVLPGNYKPVDLRPGHAPNFTSTRQPQGGEGVGLRRTLSDEGRRRVAAWAGQGIPSQAAQGVGLRAEVPVKIIEARLASPGAPWVAVKIADGGVSGRRDLLRWAARSGPDPPAYGSRG